MLRRATAFLLCALTALPPQTALAATAVFRSPTPAAQSTTPMVMSSNVPQGRIDDPYLAQFRATGGVPPYTYELVAGAVALHVKGSHLDAEVLLELLLRTEHQPSHP